MQSSTIRRSNLSKEKIAVLEALSKLKNQNNGGNNLNSGAVNATPGEDATPEVYVRSGKEKEIDLLWQNFKRPRVESSPVVYLGIGFASGVIVTLLLSMLIGLSTTESRPNFKFNLNIPSISSPVKQNSTQLNFLPSSNSASADGAAEHNIIEEYTVQSGDTMEAVAGRFYGSYSPDNVKKIMEANKITDPNRLSIGQKLVIPMGEANADISSEE